MKDDVKLINNLVKLVEKSKKEVSLLKNEVNSLEKILKDKMIESIKSDMDWARLRYDDGGPDYAERIEFADLYFKLSDILEELYDVDKYGVGEVVRLSLKVERAYSDLRSSVYINKQLTLF